MTVGRVIQERDSGAVLLAKQASRSLTLRRSERIGSATCATGTLGVMRVTVCELPDDESAFVAAWEHLVLSVADGGSDLVLLPEVPFAPWFATTPQFEPERWRRAVDAHERWLSRLGELAPAVVLATRPVDDGGRRLNEAFVWEVDRGVRPVHAKHYLPNEEGVWEASWFTRGDADFAPVVTRDVAVGFQICTELWFVEHARHYGERGAHVIANPRLTGKASVERWLVAARAAAIVAGAFVLSSNRSGRVVRATSADGAGLSVRKATSLPRRPTPSPS